MSFATAASIPLYNGAAATPEIDPLFAAHDPWLQSYFMLLRSEFETFGGGRKHPDALLVTQSMELLIRHLVCWHSSLSREHRRRAVMAAGPNPLAPRHLARVLAYIDANIGRDIALADLAQLAGASKSHFIRSFRAATQRTPLRLSGRVPPPPRGRGAVAWRQAGRADRARCRLQECTRILQRIQIALRNVAK